MEHAKIPRYRKLSPIGYWTSWACVAFDMVLSAYLYLRPFKQVEAPYHWVYFWPLVFVMIAIYLTLTLITNNMKGTRLAMILNVIVKVYWAWTLVVVINRAGIVNGLSILDLWFFVAIVQVIIAVFTPPRIDYGLITK